ncbi:MAG: hypothetical protein AABW91_03085 [Nanoarchaeota archaeon]
MRKLGQLKIQQMVFMIIAVALFFILAALFFFAIKTANLYQASIESERDKSIGLVIKLASSPEFSYRGISNGVDSDKLMALKKQPEYRDYWGINGISVKKLYPEYPEVECNTGNYPNCTDIILFKKEGDTAQSASSYISLCRKDITGGRAYDKCELALMIIETRENEF